MSSSQAIFSGQTDIELIESTIGACLEKTCRNLGIREALVFPDENRQITFMQLNSETEKLASGLLNVGLAPGDVVALWGANHADLIVSVFACAKAGLVFANLMHSATAEVVESQLNAIAAKCVICFPSVKNGHCYEIMKKIFSNIESSVKGKLASNKMQSLTHIIIAEDDGKYKGVFTLREIFEDGANKKQTEKLKDISSNLSTDQLACIQFTAGTTSSPKPVALSHYQLINGCLILAKRLHLGALNAIFCCPMPVFRGPVMCLAVLSTAVVGAKVVYPAPLPMAAVIFECIEKQKCTCIVTNPIAFHLMLRMPVARKFSLDSLNSICLGGDHVPQELPGAIEKLTQIENVISGVFLTEACCMHIIFPNDGDTTKLHKTQGKVADHFQLKIVDFNGETAKFGQPGEVCVNLIGGSKFLGYYKDSELTSKLYDLENGWLKTGDVGILDKDGYVSLLGQTNDVIFCKKSAVFPSVIEKHLLNHPSVIGVQIVGVPDKSCGEKICACVVKKDAKVDESKVKDDLIMMCKEEKLPEPHHVIFVDDFPRTTAKKIQKFKLKEIAANLASN